MSISDADFVRALLTGDRAALDALLSPDAVFHSPVRSYRDRGDVVHLLGLLATIMPGAEVLRSLTGDGRRVSVIRGEQPEGALDGMVEERRDADGRVCEVTLMLRPVPVMLPTIKRMGAALEASPLPSAAS